MILTKNNIEACKQVVSDLDTLQNKFTSMFFVLYDKDHKDLIHGTFPIESNRPICLDYKDPKKDGSSDQNHCYYYVHIKDKNSILSLDLMNNNYSTQSVKNLYSVIYKLEDIDTGAIYELRFS